MTPDVDAIRAQIANPTVLAVSLATAASLCDEIERLNDLVLDLKAEQKAGRAEVHRLAATNRTLLAERFGGEP